MFIGFLWNPTYKKGHDESAPTRDYHLADSGHAWVPAYAGMTSEGCGNDPLVGGRDNRLIVRITGILTYSWIPHQVRDDRRKMWDSNDKTTRVDKYNYSALGEFSLVFVRFFS